MLEIKKIEEIESLVLGLTILGTGGGGEPEEGFKRLKKAIEKNGSIKVVQLNELSNDALIVVPYFVGTVAPTAKSKKAERIKDPVRKAIELMEEILDKKISAIVASELGGSNTAVALSIASELGLPVVDGDLLGRAAPELHQCTVHIFGIPMYPAVIITSTGNIVVIKEYADIDDYEAIARYLSILEGRSATVVDTPMNLEKAKMAVIAGTITKAMELGNSVLKARKENRDPIEAIVENLKGWKIFEGVVKEYKWENKGGFLKGETIIEGKGKYTGIILRSYIMNEHLMAWIDNQPIVMAPDLIIFIDKEGNPITNAKLKEGMYVNIIASKAPEIWRTDKGLELFGPKRFGFDYEYVPVEELISRVL